MFTYAQDNLHQQTLPIVWIGCSTKISLLLLHVREILYLCEMVRANQENITDDLDEMYEGYGGELLCFIVLYFHNILEVFQEQHFT